MKRAARSCVAGLALLLAIPAAAQPSPDANVPANAAAEAQASIEAGGLSFAAALSPLALSFFAEAARMDSQA